MPLPIYSTIRHDVPKLVEVAKLEQDSIKIAESSSDSDVQAQEESSKKRSEADQILKNSAWHWFEQTPFEVRFSTVQWLDAELSIAVRQRRVACVLANVVAWSALRRRKEHRKAARIELDYPFGVGSPDADL